MHVFISDNRGAPLAHPIDAQALATKAAETALRVRHPVVLPAVTDKVSGFADAALAVALPRRNAVVVWATRLECDKPTLVAAVRAAFPGNPKQPIATPWYEFRVYEARAPLDRLRAIIREAEDFVDSGAVPAASLSVAKTRAHHPREARWPTLAGLRARL